MLMAKRRVRPIAEFLRAMRPRRLRTYREFAEQEFVLPSPGPLAGSLFRTSFMPWTGLVLDVFDSMAYPKLIASGPAQGGKTVLFFIIPVLYNLFELETDVILGVPTLDMAQDIYESRIKPSIQASPRFREFLPRSGSGSRGGKATSIQFTNGRHLRLMGAGGSDAQKSSYTARTVIMTELDKMDQAMESSRESSPIQQFEARTQSFVSVGRWIFGECTMSIVGGFVYRSVCIEGTNTEPWFPCPTCDAYQPLVRECVIGWQDAKSKPQAEDMTRYICQKCGALWNEEDRLRALRSPILVSEGQTVTSTINGPIVEGTARETDIFGFRWNGLASPMTPLPYIGGEEWEAHTRGSDILEKRQKQFLWALPHIEDISDLTPLDATVLQKRTESWAKGTVPAEWKHIALGIDVGKWQCHWSLVVMLDNDKYHIADYGAFDVPSKDMEEEQAILTALRDFHTNAIETGWPVASASMYVRPEAVIVDSGYKADAVHKFCNETDGAIASKGYGTVKKWGVTSIYKRPHRRSQNVRIIGEGWHISREAQPRKTLLHIDADEWKRRVHASLSCAKGEPGCMTIYDAKGTTYIIHGRTRQDTQPHMAFFKSITAERQRIEVVEGRGQIVRFHVYEKNKSHWLDATAEAMCGIDYAERMKVVNTVDTTWFSRQTKVK